MTDRRGEAFAKAFRRAASMRCRRRRPTARAARQGRGGADARPRHAQGARSRAAAQARRDRGLRRLSDGRPAACRPACCEVPSILHEQNAVLGRANRFLAKRVDVIATGFADDRRRRSSASRQDRVMSAIRCGPPWSRRRRRPYEPPREGGVLRLLVFGGSQGARIMSDIVPAAIARLTAPERARLEIVQQVRQEDFARVREAYARSRRRGRARPLLPRPAFPHGAKPARRSRAPGASTVAEISVIGRPSILVPLPGSLDQDQAGNARSLADIGAATMLGAGAIRAGGARRDALANPVDALAPRRDGGARPQGRHSRRGGAPRRSRAETAGCRRAEPREVA